MENNLTDVKIVVATSLPNYLSKLIWQTSRIRGNVWLVCQRRGDEYQAWQEYFNRELADWDRDTLDRIQ